MPSASVMFFWYSCTCEVRRPIYVSICCNKHATLQASSCSRFSSMTAARASIEAFSKIIFWILNCVWHRGTSSVLFNSRGLFCFQGACHTDCGTRFRFPQGSAAPPASQEKGGRVQGSVYGGIKVQASWRPIFRSAISAAARQALSPKARILSYR